MKIYALLVMTHRVFTVSEEQILILFYILKNIIKTHNLLEKEIPLILKKLQWKKAMKWSDFDLYWGRPLESIFCIYDKKLVNFSLHHLSSTTKVIVDREFEEKTRSFNFSKDYFDFFKINRIFF